MQGVSVAEFVRVGRVEEIEEGGVIAVVVDGVELVLARCEGVIYALDNVCTHAHAYLSEGEVDTDDCTIECPLHGARFDLATGRARSLPATVPARTFPVRVADGQIEVVLD